MCKLWCSAMKTKITIQPYLKEWASSRKVTWNCWGHLLRIRTSCLAGCWTELCDERTADLCSHWGIRRHITHRTSWKWQMGGRETRSGDFTVVTFQRGSKWIWYWLTVTRVSLCISSKLGHFLCNIKQSTHVHLNYHPYHICRTKLKLISEITIQHSWYLQIHVHFSPFQKSNWFSLKSQY